MLRSPGAAPLRCRNGISDRVGPVEPRHVPSTCNLETSIRHLAGQAFVRWIGGRFAFGGLPEASALAGATSTTRVGPGRPGWRGHRSRRRLVWLPPRPGPERSPRRRRVSAVGRRPCRCRSLHGPGHATPKGRRRRQLARHSRAHLFPMSGKSLRTAIARELDWVPMFLTYREGGLAGLRSRRHGGEPATDDQRAEWWAQAVRRSPEAIGWCRCAAGARGARGPGVDAAAASSSTADVCTGC